MQFKSKVERIFCTTEITKYHAVMIRTRYTTLCRSEIQINLKIDAEDLNRRCRRFCVRRPVHHISGSEGSLLVIVHALTV
jgi:hypothetical protein